MLKGHLPMKLVASNEERGVNCGGSPRNLHYCRRSDRSKGQELAEFAIVLPLLLLIVFGVLDLGRLFHALITITNAAREGARYAMIFPDDLTGIDSVTRREAQNSGITLDPGASSVSVTYPQGFGEHLPVRVTVTYRFQLFIAGILPSTNLTLMRYAEMMVP
jgi:Flp pilus assembly protein TadG